MGGEQGRHKTVPYFTTSKQGVDVDQITQVVGALLILAGFVLAQFRVLRVESMTYLVLNFTGSAILAWLAWVDRQWVEYPTHTVRRVYDFPVVGEQAVYLNGHDELHSLYKNIDANSIRFWMGFGDHYINVFTVLRTLGLLSHLPVHVGDQEVVPLQVVKAVLPDPQTLAAGYAGKTCIGNIVIGRVVHVFVRDDVINDRHHLDAAKIDAVGRMGGLGYTRTRDRFELPMGRDALGKDIH